MRSKVLIIGNPAQGCSQSLSEEFDLQPCVTPAEALAAAPSARALLCSLSDEAATAEFLQDAIALNTALRIAVFIPADWSPDFPTLAETIPMLLLPADTAPAVAAANLRQHFRPKTRGLETTDNSTPTLEHSVDGTVSALYEILSIIDPYSASLGQRLRYATDLFCKAAHLPLTWELETGALLCEVGILT
ncbi:MAG: hypothetical protein ACXW32_12365, partial [Limisphaerales bacterium]